MKPYFESDGITIFHADCREILPSLLPHHSIDLVLTDPPYGETSLSWDTPVVDWLGFLPTVLSPAGSLWCFGSMKFFLNHAAEFSRWQYAQEIVWEKHNGTGHFSDRFRRVHELLTHWYPHGVKWSEVYKSPQFTTDATARTIRRKGQPAQWIGARGPSLYESHDGGPRLMRSVQYVRTCHGYATHPTQKPEGIVRPPMLYSCPPNGLVLDCFMGSGTTLSVARQEGRRAIGIEIDERSCELAAQRLSQQILLTA